MDQLDERIKLIERYFEGDLSAEERRAFEEKLATDEAFAEAFAMEKKIMYGIEESGNRRLRARLDQLMAEESGKETVPSTTAKVRKFPRFGSLALAASLLILVSVGIWWLLQPAAPDQIFASYYETPPFEELRGGEESPPDREAAKRLYQAKDFRGASEKLESYLQTGAGEARDSLLLGICFLELGDFTPAARIFQSLKSNLEINDQAIWYLALTYLRQEAWTEAKEELTLLTDGSVLTGPQRTQAAKRILEMIK